MKSSSLSIAERIVRTLFGLAFCAFPIFILSLLARSSFRERDVRLNWVPTPCVIVDSEIRDAPNGSYSLTVRYRYETGGKTYVSTGYSPDNDHHTFDSVSERAPLLATYEKGASATCFVNPADPAQAVLHSRDGNDSPWAPAILILFLIPFIIVGLAVAASAWWPRRRRDAKDASPVPSVSSGTAEPVSRPSALAVAVPIVFCAVFIAIGGGLMSFGLRQRARAQASRDWPVAEGVIERIEVKREWQNGGKGRHGRWLYSPYVVYAYEVNGSRRVNDRLAFIKTSSSKQGPAVRYVEEHPVGSRVGVRYNLADPADSVLDAPDAPRSGSMDDWLLIGAGAVFAMFGIGFLIVILTSPPEGKGRNPVFGAGGVLQRKNRGGDLVQMIVFTTMWCSLSTLLCMAFFSDTSWPPKGEDWIPTIILSVFACIGIGLFVRLQWTILNRILSGGLHLEIRCPRGFVARGGETDFTYRLVGRVENVASLVVHIVAKRKIHVRHQGENRIESRETYRREVLHAATPHEIGQGFFRVELPDDAPPSGRDGDGIVTWALTVSGKRRGGGEFHDTYPVEVR